MPDSSFAQYHLFTGHMVYTFANLLRRPVVITLLRDPLERAISHFAQLQRNGKAELLTLENIPSWSKLEDSPVFKYWHDDITLEEYIDNPDLRLDLENLQARYLGTRRPVDYMWQHPNRKRRRPPMVRFFLPCALERLESCAYVGLVERFAESVDLLTYTFGWQPEDAMPELNRSPKRLNQETLSPEVIAILRALNVADIAVYQRAQSLFQHRLDTMRQALLSLDYVQRYHHLQTDHITLDTEGVLPGVGWQPADKHNPNFRWTGPGTEATLDLPLTRDRTLRLTLRIFDVLAQNILDSFHIRVNQQPVAISSTPHPAGGLLLSADLTPDLLTSQLPYTRISFHVSHTLRPSEIRPANLDDRALGVAIGEISVMPLERR